MTGLVVAVPGNGEDLTPASLHAEVLALDSPAHGYALYLPSALATGRRLPLAIAFDMRDGAAELAAALAPGAERFGWLIAAPHGSSNLEPTAANAARMSAVWRDVLARFPVDERRVYVVGFSGLSRFACQLVRTAPDRLAGVIGINGGFPEDAPPTAADRFPFFGVVAERDFTYYEQLDLEERLAALGITSRFTRYDGSHQRPPAEVAERALAWFELRAMATGVRPHDAALVESIWEDGVGRAREAETAGRLAAAARDWRALAADFAGLREVTAAELRLRALADDPRLREQQEAEERRLRRDRRFLEQVPRLLAAAGPRAEPGAIADLLAALEIPDWKRRRERDPDAEERAAAERVLYAVYIQAGNYAPRRLSERGDYERAILLLRVAAEIEPEIPHVRYRLAVAYAHLGQRRSALAELERAIELGWDDRVAIEREVAFDPWRQSEEFGFLVGRLPPVP